MFGFGAKPKPQPAPKREPETIIDNHMNEMHRMRNHHASAMQRWSEIIADAQARLHYHTLAHDTIASALRPLEHSSLEPQALLGELDMSDVQTTMADDGIALPMTTIDEQQRAENSINAPKIRIHNVHEA